MSDIKDPLHYLTVTVRKLEEQVQNLVSEALILKQAVDKWRNMAGIMHEYIQEGDPEGAKDHYEQECRGF